MRKLERLLRYHYEYIFDNSKSLFIDQVSAHEINSKNYLIRCGAPDATPSFVLKDEAIQDMASIHIRQQKVDLYVHCSASLDILPSLLETGDGNLCVVLENHLYVLLEFCAGDVYCNSPFAIAEAARGLAKLHGLLRNTRKSFSHSLRREDLNRAETETVIKKLQNGNYCSSFSGKVLQLVRGDLQVYYEEYYTTLEKSNLAQDLIHWDFHTANAIFRQHRLVAILDMDSIATDFRIQAISFSCDRFAGTRGIWYFLSAYDQIDPLTTEEICLYPLFVRREAVKRINWIIRANVLEDQNLWRHELDKHLSIIRQSYHLDAVFTPSKAEQIRKMKMALLELDQEKNKIL